MVVDGISENAILKSSNARCLRLSPVFARRRRLSNASVTLKEFSLAGLHTCHHNGYADSVQQLLMYGCDHILAGRQLWYPGQVPGNRVQTFHEKTDRFEAVISCHLDWLIQYSIELQINHQISVNSVKASISYNGFSEVAPKQGVHYSNHADLTVNVYVCANIRNSLNLCSKCHLCIRLQARTHGRQSPITLSMNTWWKCSHSPIRRDFVTTSRIRLRYTRSYSFSRIS